MGIFSGSSSPSFKVGNNSVNKIYLGSTEVWSACATTQASLLCHFNGSNGSTSFIDSSTNNFSITYGGNAAISTAESKFGGSSLYLTNGDYITIQDSLFDMESDDYTIEFWWYPITQTSSDRVIVFENNGASNGLIVDGSNLVWNYFGDGSPLSATSVPNNEWHHIAIVKYGSYRTLYIDGIAKSTTTSALIPSSTNRVNLGASLNNYIGLQINAYYDDIRITRGLAIYTDCFIVPNSESTTCPETPTPCAPSLSVDYLVVGGGGGSTGRGGGGGGGGFREGTAYSITASTNYTVTVGGGGAGLTGDIGTPGGNGSDSTFDTITSAGGGGGGSWGATPYNVSDMTGQNGGCGGGGGCGWYTYGPGGYGNTPGTLPVQGYDGGTGYSTYNASVESCGGGGGAGSVGEAADQSMGDGGDGGGGAQSVITTYYYGGGGGGGGNPGATPGWGGSGGGGNGNTTGNAGDGSVNTGGGGGGTTYYNYYSGNGGAGVVVLKFPNTLTISVGYGLTYSYTTSGSDYIYTFTAGSDTVSFT
jgi:hypothetical protein